MISKLTPEKIPLLMMVAAAGILGTAYFFENVLGILPCALCHYQRLAWWLVLGVAGLTYYMRKRPALLLSGITLSSLIAVAGGFLAAYHVGVEQTWWEGPSACSSSAFNTTDIQALKEAIMSAPLIRCDEIAWSLFGISMAGYNAILALGTGVSALILTRTMVRQKATAASARA